MHTYTYICIYNYLCLYSTHSGTSSPVVLVDVCGDPDTILGYVVVFVWDLGIHG